MTDIIASLNGFQFGKESTAGTLVAATRKFATLSVDMGPESTIATYDAQGVLVSVGTVIGQEWTSGTGKGALDMEEALYWHSAFLKTPSPSQIDTTAAYLFDFTPSASSEDSADTWSGEWGNQGSGKGFTAAYVRPTDTTYKANRKEMTLDGKMIGQRMTKGATMTSSGSITGISKTSAIPSKCDFFLADSMAGLDGADALDRAFEAEISLANRWVPVWPVKSTYPSWAALVPGKMKANAKLTVGALDTGGTILDYLRNGQRLFMRIRAFGADIAAAPSAPSAPTGSASASGGSLASGSYLFSVSYVTACGETVATPVAAGVTVTGPSGKITVASISSIPATVTHVNYYLDDGAGGTKYWVKQTAVAAGTAAATDLTTTGTTLAGTPKTTSTAALKHLLQLDVALEVSKIGKFGDTDGIVTQAWEFEQVYDSVSSRFLRVRAVTETETLTY